VLSYEEARERFQKLIPEFETLLAAEGSEQRGSPRAGQRAVVHFAKVGQQTGVLRGCQRFVRFLRGYENASGQPGAVRAALQKLNAGQFLEDNVETHIGADYSIHKFVSVLSAVDGFANAVLKSKCLIPMISFDRKKGWRPVGFYGLGKEIKPSGWVQIDRFEYTGNLRDDLKHFQRRARENGFVYVNVETPDGQSVPIRMIDLPRGGLFPGDAASHWRVNALKAEYQGFEEISLGRDGRPGAFSLERGSSFVSGRHPGFVAPGRGAPGDERSRDGGDPRPFSAPPDPGDGHPVQRRAHSQTTGGSGATHRGCRLF
jgi:hypothetical protein